MATILPGKPSAHVTRTDASADGSVGGCAYWEWADAIDRPTWDLASLFGCERANDLLANVQTCLACPLDGSAVIADW